MLYEDFSLQILPAGTECYGVFVDSHEGKPTGELHLPEEGTSGAWEALSLGTRDLGHTSVPSQASPTARAVGDLLFRSLLKGAVRTAFDQSLSAARVRGRGLRIRLRIHPQAGPALALPWELLYYAETGDFLGLDRTTPIVRGLDVLRATTGRLDHRLRILALAASPRGLGALDLERECRNLRAACREGRDVELIFLRRHRLEDLRRTLLQTPFHVLHFMGHGTFDEASGEGALQLEGPDGEPLPVSGRDLALELKGFPDLRLVVLNACKTGRVARGDGLHPFAGVASALLREGIPAVVAMRASIPDLAAIAFSQTLYRRLVAGEPVDAAVTEARMAIRREAGEDGGWNLPMLFLLGPDGALFQPGGLRPRVKAGLLIATLVSFLLGSGFTFRQTYQALARNNQGVESALAGRDAEARAELAAALRLIPDFAPAHANLADLEERAGHYQEALFHARSAVRAVPDSALYRYNLGRLLAQAGEIEPALESLGEAVERNPRYAAAYNEMANLYLDLGRPADARRAVERGLAGTPGLPYLVKNRGRVSLEEGRPRAAVPDLEAAVRLYARQGLRDLEEPLYWLAEAYARTGQVSRACDRLAEFGRLTAGVGARVEEARHLADRMGCEAVP